MPLITMVTIFTVKCTAPPTFYASKEDLLLGSSPSYLHPEHGLPAATYLFNGSWLASAEFTVTYVHHSDNAEHLVRNSVQLSMYIVYPKFSVQIRSINTPVFMCVQQTANCPVIHM